MPAAKFFLQTASPLHKAVNHILTVILAIPADSIIAESDYFAVKEGANVHVGLLPMLSVLRRSIKDEKHGAFLGSASLVAVASVNQWVSVAAQLSNDAVFYDKYMAAKEAADGAEGKGYVSVFHAITDEVEQQIAEAGSAQSYLNGSAGATIADVLLYSAINDHPVVLAEGKSSAEQTESAKKVTVAQDHFSKHPLTMQWSQFVEANEYLAPLKSSYVANHAAASAAASATKTTYAKPNAEEIERRRIEKEKLKAQKAAEKAAAAAAGGAAEAKAPAQPAKQGAANAKEDPQTLVIRVACMKSVKPHPEADRLYVEDMDVGGDDQRTIVSGLVEHYKEEELNGRLCLVIANMKPKPLKGIESQGMVLCASNESGLTLIQPPEGSKPGDRVLFGAAGTDYATLETETAAKPQPAKQLSGSVMTEVLAHLRTDANGTLVWKDTVGVLSSGVVTVPDRVSADVR